MTRYIGLALSAFATAAQAQAPAFEQVDANGDGVINRAEAQAVRQLDFSACDADRDGYLSRQEYVACTGSAQ